MMLRFLSPGCIFFLSFFNHWVFLNKKWKRGTVMDSRLGHKMECCGCKQHKLTYPLLPLHLSSPQLNSTSASNSALYKYNPSSWLFTAWAGYSLLDLPSLILSLLWSGLVLRAFRRQDLVSSGPFWICSGQSREDSLSSGAWTSPHVVWGCLHWQAAECLLKVTAEAGCAVNTSQEKRSHSVESLFATAGNHADPSHMISSPDTRDTQADKGWVCH